MDGTFVEVEHLLPVDKCPFEITEPSKDRLWGRRVKVIVEDVMPETRVWIGGQSPLPNGGHVNYFLGQVYWPQGKRNVGKIVINCPTVVGDWFTHINIRCWSEEHQMQPISVDLGKAPPGEHVINMEQWIDPVMQDWDQNALDGWMNRLKCRHTFGKWGESFVHEWSGFFGIYCKGRFQIRSCSKCTKTKIRQIQL